MHWRSASPRLRQLAEAQAWKYDSYMEDAEEDHDGSIEVTFGSTGATIFLRYTDDEAHGLYGYGYCTFLAYAIHKAADLPLVLFTAPSESGWQGHAAVKVGEDAYLDIAGVNTFAEIKEKYRELRGEPEVVTEEKFITTVMPDRPAHTFWDFIEELEQLVTEDFAAFLLEENAASIERS